MISTRNTSWIHIYKMLCLAVHFIWILQCWNYIWERKNQESKTFFIHTWFQLETLLEFTITKCFAWRYILFDYVYKEIMFWNEMYRESGTFLLVHFDLKQNWTIYLQVFCYLKYNHLIIIHTRLVTSPLTSFISNSKVAPKRNIL